MLWVRNGSRLVLQNSVTPSVTHSVPIAFFVTPGMTHSIPTAFIMMNAVGTELVMPGGRWLECSGQNKTHEQITRNLPVTEPVRNCPSCRSFVSP